MVLQELKKIWTPTRIFCFIALSVLMYASFISPIIKRFETGNGIDAFHEKMQISKEWVSRYGSTVEPEEYADIENEYREMIRKIDASMSDKEIFSECGVESYDEFLTYEVNAVNGKEGYDYGKYKEMRELLFADSTYNAVYLQEYRELMADYEKASEEYNAILPEEVIIYTTDFLIYLSIWCFITVLLISSPVMVNDVASNMNTEQYTSKIGKKIYRKQYWCTMFSVLLAEAIVIVIGIIVWKTTGTSAFSRVGLNSFMYHMKPTLKIKYSCMFGLFVLIIGFLGIGVGSIAFCLSSRSSNVISMLIKVTPLAVVAGAYILGLTNAFFRNNIFYNLTHIPGIEILLAAAIAVFGIVINRVNYYLIRSFGKQGLKKLNTNDEI